MTIYYEIDDYIEKYDDCNVVIDENFPCLKLNSNEHYDTLDFKHIMHKFNKNISIDDNKKNELIELSKYNDENNLTYNFIKI